MQRRKFIPLPKILRRTQSNASAEAGTAEDPIEVDGDPIEVDSDPPHPTDSTPDPGIGPSTLPPSSLLAPSDQESNGMSLNPYQMIHLTALFDSDRDAVSGPPPFTLRKGKRTRKNAPDDTTDPRPTSKSKQNVKALASAATKLALRGVNEIAEAFPPLKATASTLCFILDNCEVCQPPVHCLIKDTYFWLREQWHVTERYSRSFLGSNNWDNR